MGEERERILAVLAGEETKFAGTLEVSRQLLKPEASGAGVRRIRATVDD